MKVLIIHTNYAYHGGEDVVVKKEIELMKNYYTVEELCFQNSKNLKGAFQFLTSIWNIKKSRIVKNKIKSFQPNVVHIHNWHFATGPLIIRTIRRMKVPIVCTLHNYRLLCPSGVLLHNNELFKESLKQDFPWNAVFNRVYRNSFLQTFWLAYIVWFHKKIKTWQMVDKYIVLAPFAIDLFCESKLNIPKERFIVKPNFTTNKTPNSFSLQKEAHFLFVGRLSQEKGIHDLVKAFKDLPYVLKIAGDGPLRAYVEQSQLKHPNIVYLGPLSPTNVTQEMQKASALVFSSIWLETFGLTIIESFSNQCAVITSNIGAPPTIVTDGKDGFHYEFGNVPNLISVIVKWISLPVEEKQIMQQEALKTFISKYSSQKQFDYFEIIYNNVLDFRQIKAR